MKNFNSGLRRQRPHNRIAAIMAHTSRYAMNGRSRLAQDCDLGKSTITKIVSGGCSPSYDVVSRIAEALSKALGRRIEIQEVVSRTGAYPTTWVCELVGCR